MFKPNVAIVGTPRSGSSFLSQFFVDQGWQIPSFENSIPMSGSKFNPDGYFESTNINLLNDQLIRGLYGEQYSFLYPPKISNTGPRIEIENFSFDLAEETVQIPADYQENIVSYTGENWDVWGLTRMVDGGKWHRAYSRLGISNQDDLRAQLASIKNYLSSTTGKIVKDSRLTFTMQMFGDIFSKVIILTRDSETLEKSIKNHYGQRIFTNDTYEGYSWVSNHFNYRIAPMDFKEYLIRYETYYTNIENSCPNVLRVRLESLNDEQVKKSILSFCER